MKPTITILAILANMVVAKGQTYLPCLGSNQTKWTEIVQNEFPIMYELAVRNDTLINGQSYKWMDYSFAIRQDSTHSKLYILNMDYSDEEYLIMDLNLNKGDTFELKNPQLPKSIKVDSVYMMDNKKVVEFNYEIQNYTGGLEKFKFIEGIGTNMGITYQFIMPMLDYPYLLCYTNDSYNFRSSAYSSCFFLYDGLREVRSDGIKVNHNPTSDFIQIQFIDHASRILTLIDLNGSVVKQFESGSSESILNLGNCKCGLYLLKIVDDRGNCYVKRVVKQ
jgi:hypothetical protein